MLWTAFSSMVRNALTSAKVTPSVVVDDPSEPFTILPSLNTRIEPGVQSELVTMLRSPMIRSVPLAAAAVGVKAPVTVTVPLV